MEAAYSAPSTSSTYSFHFSLAQAVLTISLNVIAIGLSALVKSSSSSASSSPSARRRAAAPAAEAEAAVDLDTVLGLMGGAGGAPSVGFEEAAALFEEEEATVGEAAAAFRVFDRNGDGFIDAGELGSVLASLGLGAGAGAGHAECQRMIDAYDADKDGRIDFREFLKLMETAAA
uniref:EF-hand domain-containing protein n=1 Tax=Oryza meridionalis TaxID=40149 RepID=A0A0E0ES50_9ORYZ